MTECTAIPHISVALPLDSDEDAKAGATAILAAIKRDWAPSSLSFQFFTEGITNRILSAFADDRDDRVLFRIYGHNTQLIIDRASEMATMEFLGRRGLAPRIFATFDNGLVYGFLPGRVLDVTDVRDLRTAKLIARRLAEMHSLQPTGPETLVIPKTHPVAAVKTKDWINKLPASFDDPGRQERFTTFPGKDQLSSEREEWSQLLTELGSPLVFAHNDLLVKNIIHSRDKGQVNFIDFEYAGFNFQAFDIGNHFDEYAGFENSEKCDTLTRVTDIDFSLYPSEEYQRWWLGEYLECLNGSEPTPKELSKLYLQAAHFFWAVWAIIQAKYSTIDFDFLQYGLDRMEQYRLLRAKFFDRARDSLKES